MGDLVKSDGTWVIGDPIEEEEERREREEVKRGYIQEAMRKKAEDKTGALEPAPVGALAELSQMD